MELHPDAFRAHDSPPAAPPDAPLYGQYKNPASLNCPQPEHPFFPVLISITLSIKRMGPLFVFQLKFFFLMLSQGVLP